MVGGYLEEPVGEEGTYGNWCLGDGSTVKSMVPDNKIVSTLVTFKTFSTNSSLFATSDSIRSLDRLEFSWKI